MKNKQEIAYLVLEKDRLILEYKFKSRTLSRTDVTPLWNFFKDFEDYLKQPHS